jgi:hypothetical protein
MSNKFWNTDRQVKLDGLPTTITLAGDATGSYAANTVAKINGATVPAGGALTTGNVLQVTGASALSYSALNLAGGAGYVTGTLPVGNLPSMGGDVTGTIAASVVAKVNGATAEISTNALVGEVLMTTSAGAMLYRPILTFIPSQAMKSNGTASTCAANDSPLWRLVAEQDHYVQFEFYSQVTRDYLVQMHVSNDATGSGDFRIKVQSVDLPLDGSADPNYAIGSWTSTTFTKATGSLVEQYVLDSSTNACFTVNATADRRVLVRVTRFSLTDVLDTASVDLRVHSAVVR